MKCQSQSNHMNNKRTFSARGEEVSNCLVENEENRWYAPENKTIKERVRGVVYVFYKMYGVWRYSNVKKEMSIALPVLGY